MTRIGARIAKLERNRPKPVVWAALDCDLPPEICARIAKAQAAGTFPQSLADADLEAIVAAADKTKGEA